MLVWPRPHWNCGHMLPNSDETTRAAITGVITARQTLAAISRPFEVVVKYLPQGTVICDMRRTPPHWSQGAPRDDPLRQADGIRRPIQLTGQLAECRPPALGPRRPEGPRELPAGMLSRPGQRAQASSDQIGSAVRSPQMAHLPHL
jgi:hypothetical protein